jgi:hypothetical protein
MGLQVCQLLATLCVALSLALFALGSVDLIGVFGLQTLSFSSPTVIVGPVLVMVAVFHNVEGVICKE